MKVELPKEQRKARQTEGAACLSSQRQETGENRMRRGRGRWIYQQFIVAGVWGPKVLRAGGFREMKTSSGVGKT